MWNCIIAIGVINYIRDIVVGLSLIDVGLIRIDSYVIMLSGNVQTVQNVT